MNTLDVLDPNANKRGSSGGAADSFARLGLLQCCRPFLNLVGVQVLGEGGDGAPVGERWSGDARLVAWYRVCGVECWAVVVEGFR